MEVEVQYMNELVQGGRELLDSVQPLWDKLNKHHEISSKIFPDKYRNKTFDVRKRKFAEEQSLKVNIDLIKNSEKDLYIGYCISTLNKELAGEIDSLFIDEEYRELGLGDILMNRALEWLDINNAKTKNIGVSEGNERVLEFYKRYGFYKRRVILEQINE